MSDLPAKPLKRMLKRHHPEQVSDGAVVALRQMLEVLTDMVGRQAVKEFENYNERREALGLRPKVRLNEFEVYRAAEKVLSRYDISDGEGLQSRRVVSPG